MGWSSSKRVLAASANGRLVHVFLVATHMASQDVSFRQESGRTVPIQDMQQHCHIGMLELLEKTKWVYSRESLSL